MGWSGGSPYQQSGLADVAKNTALTCSTGRKAVKIVSIVVRHYYNHSYAFCDLHATPGSHARLAACKLVVWAATPPSCSSAAQLLLVFATLGQSFCHHAARKCTFLRMALAVSFMAVCGACGVYSRGRVSVVLARTCASRLRLACAW